MIYERMPFVNSISGKRCPFIFYIFKAIKNRPIKSKAVLFYALPYSIKLSVSNRPK
jgi:hypothetical protein